jgi:cytochrome d ubiquinol oxidase subunit I
MPLSSLRARQVDRCRAPPEIAVATMDDVTFWSRLQFGFTITYHYLFPQLTMGLAPFIAAWKWRAWRSGDERCRTAARFWAIIFGINFVVGVVTGIPMEFPFGTTASQFSAHPGGVIGQTRAMEGWFESGPMADIDVIGQPNVRERRIDNPIRLPGALSYLATGSYHGEVRGLGAFPEDQWPTNVELLYYAFHIMVGLGTLFIALMLLATVQLALGRLESSRGMLWELMLAFPFPYIATTAGWMTAELGRQPWLIYGLYRTSEGASRNVHSGTVLFTLVGFAGLYFVVGVAYLVLIGREIARGPGPRHHPYLPAGETGAAHD